jgi:hypothetical protein
MQMECALARDEAKENILRDGRICRIPWPAVTAMLALALPAGAQQLRLSRAVGDPGGSVTLTLSIRSPSGQQPAGLQWTVSVPDERLKMPDDFAAISATAKGAGKSVHCALAGEPASARAATCILAGGREPLPDGPVATLRFNIAAAARPGEVALRIREASAVSADSKLKRLPESAGKASIRRR